MDNPDTTPFGRTTIFGTDPKILKQFGFENQEIFEDFKEQWVATGYPMPMKRYRLVWEAYNLSMEEPYYWVLRYIHQDWAYPYVIKTIDTFAAAENSSFFGVSQQRLGLQQDKVSQFLATIGKMTKELFQLVRELRVIDERRDYYISSNKGEMGSEITLKGIWIDMVEQGAKNPASVYGMARELQFTTLPDLFFAAPVMEPDDVEKYVDRLEFNRKVKEVLVRKLKTFAIWKKHTFKELNDRRSFTIKYLRQHYDIIKMYMNWVRPYLRNIQRLNMDLDKLRSPELVSAFEGSMVEIEFLAYKASYDQTTGEQNKKFYSAIIAHFLYRTRPTMSYQQEGYQRGPLHVGKVEFVLRGYVWKKEQIQAYIKMKDALDMELMKSISGSVKAAYDALGDELKKYLEEAGESFEEEKKKVEEKLPPKPGFFSIFKNPAKTAKKEIKLSEYEEEVEKGRAKPDVLGTMWETFKNFKKAHRMMAW